MYKKIWLSRFSVNTFKDLLITHLSSCRNRNKKQVGILPPPQPLPANGFDGTILEDAANLQGVGSSWRGDGEGRGGRAERGARGRPKTYTNNSGKSWRHGTDEDAGGSKGGKCKYS